MPVDDPIAIGVSPLAPWGKLPKSARLLCVTTSNQPVDWLRDLFASDNSMTLTVEAALGVADGLARLREEAFDAVLVRHVPGELDALAFVAAHRASGADDALIVLGDELDPAFAPLCYEVGADAYVPTESASPRQLIWVIARAIEWHRLVRENHRLAQYERQRLRLEHSEAERLLVEQRGLIAGLEELTQPRPVGAAVTDESLTTSTNDPLEVPTSLVDHYVELLRAHVIMGSGNLAKETATIVDTFFSLDMPARRVMQVHLHVLEATLRGLGSRSSRHVMARADLLVLEVMTQLAERYRQNPPQADQK